MRSLICVVAVLILEAGLLGPQASRAAETPPSWSLLSGGPAGFEPSPTGSAAGPAFLARGKAWQALLASDSTAWRVFGENPRESRLVRVRLAGADRRARVELLDPLSRRSHYYLGSDASKWRENVPHYGRVRFHEIYPGVDVVYYWRGENLEYDFEVAAGADFGRVELLVDAPEAVVGPAGELVIDSGLGEIRHRLPQVYQTAGDSRRSLTARFVQRGENRFGFEVDGRDPHLPLTIDPVVELATYLGGGGNGIDLVTDVASGPNNDIWVVGRTNAADFPGLADDPVGPIENVYRGYLVRYARGAGSEGLPAWSVDYFFFGGSTTTLPVGVDVDPDGNVYVFGDTFSDDFPQTDHPLSRPLRGSRDFFVAVLGPTPAALAGGAVNSSSPLPHQGTALITAFLFGGGAGEVAEGAQTFPLNVPFVSPGRRCLGVYGTTDSEDYPVTAGAVQSENRGRGDVVVSYFCRGDSGELEHHYSTLAGGEQLEAFPRVGFSSDGTFALCMTAVSKDLPVTEGALQSTVPDGTFDPPYVASYRVGPETGGAATGSLEAATYFSGGGSQVCGGMSVHPLGIVAVLAATDEFPFLEPSASLSPRKMGSPVVAQETNPGGASTFIGVLDRAFTEVKRYLWIGGSSGERAFQIAETGDCFVIAGSTSSADYPVTDGAPQTQAGGGGDAFVTKVCLGDPEGIQYSSYIAGPGLDLATNTAVTPDGRDIIVGTSLGGLVTTPNAPRPEIAGGGRADVFVVELFQPVLQRRAIVGAGDFQQRDLAAGGLLSIFGASFGPDGVVTLDFDEQGKLLTQLGPTRVLFDGEPAPMVFTSKNQVSAFAPFSIAAKADTMVEVEVNGQLSNAVRIPVGAAAPNIFSVSQTGSGQGAILNQDFSRNGPANPEQIGRVVQIFLTGIGETDPPGVDGELIPSAPPFPAILGSVVVRIGAINAQVLYKGGAPGLLHGVGQINAIIPEGVTPGDAVAVEVEIAGIVSQQGITLAVAP